MSFDYNVSMSGLNVARKGLQVTQNNIANAKTEGYARQRLDVHVQDTLTGAGTTAQIGNGVYTSKIERIKDDLLIQQVRSQNGRVSYYQTLESGLQNVESIVGELNEGALGNVMQDFFNSWEELSKYPMEKSYRESVSGNAQQLSFKLNAISQDLGVYRNELDTKIEVDIQDANGLIQQLANVNKEILNATNQQPNPLLDKRDAYIDKLSRIGDVRIVQNSENEHVYDIEFGGRLVVSGTVSEEVKGIYDKDGDRWVIAVGNMPVRLNQGSLIANMEVRNNYIPETAKKIDEVASVIIAEVNALHRNAFALDGTTGHDFFGGTNAKTMHVRSAILNNADLMAISDTLGENGNANVARQLADLQLNATMLSGHSPLEDWTGYVVSFGQALYSIENNASVYENVLNDLTVQKQGVQGVDIDEELAKLMEYEKYYQSNAKTLQTVDKAFEVLLQMV